MEKIENVLNVQQSKLISALIKARSEMGEIKKSGVNPMFKSRYSTLDDILSVAIEPLLKHGLALTHELRHSDKEDGGYILVTRLEHVEGGQIVIELPIVGQIGNMQQLGSAITYARRYSIQMLLGLNVEEDDDANRAVSQTPPQKRELPNYAPKLP